MQRLTVGGRGTQTRYLANINTAGDNFFHIQRNVF